MIDPNANVEAVDHSLALIAGEALVENDAVYVSAADGKVYKTDADSIASIAFVGFAQKSVALNATAYIRYDGHKSGFSGLTVNAPVFLSTVAGGVTSTKPTNYKIIGIAVSATTIRITRDLTKRVQVFTASGTWTKPAGLVCADVKVQAAGGSGNSTAGGGAGGYSEKHLLASELGATETITIGAASAGTGNTSFGSLLVCANGGNAATNTPGNGGTATGGDINIPGQSGQAGAQSQGGGAGGHSPLGFGGHFTPPGPSTSTRGGTSGSGYGSGGSGNADASDGSPSASGVGGAGVQGIIIVTEYY